MSSARTRAGTAVASLLLSMPALVAIGPAAHADSGPPSTATATPTATDTPAPSATSSPSASPSEATSTESPTESPTAPSTTAVPRPTPTSTAAGAPDPSGSPTRATVRIAGPAATGSTGQQAADAAAFVATTLAAGGDHYVYPGTTYLDGGNTIDAILALDEAGAGQDEAAAATAYLVAHLGDYVGSGGETYAGPTAKALLAVMAQGLDPHAVGGTDLLATLEGLQTPSGRFSDVSAYGDYSNTIGQALAIIALARSGAPVPAAAVDFLGAQQCPDGGFRIDPTAGDCASDPDATGFAVQSLLAVPVVPRLDTAASAGAGLDHLVAVQGADGGFTSASGGENANTTGVAAQAFAAAGRTAPLDRAQAFLAALQYDCSFPAAVRGGIAFTSADHATRATAGSRATPDDGDLRATPQAALGLAGGSLASVSASGATAGAPAMTCAVAAGASTSGTSAPSTGPSTSTAVGDPTSLAYTGAPPLGPALLGLGLVVVGAAAVGCSTLLRRRGTRT
jgi:hypothetical protein